MPPQGRIRRRQPAAPPLLSLGVLLFSLLLLAPVLASSPPSPSHQRRRGLSLLPQSTVATTLTAALRIRQPFAFIPSSPAPPTTTTTTTTRRRRSSSDTRRRRRRESASSPSVSPSTTSLFDTKDGRTTTTTSSTSTSTSTPRRPFSALLTKARPTQPADLFSLSSSSSSSSSPPTGGEGKNGRLNAVSSGVRQIWDSLSGKVPASGGSGNNNAFKVMLATVAMVYGTNFGAIKYLDEANVDVAIVTCIRFALASLSLAPFLYKAPMHVIARGAEVGVWVSAGYIAQAIGLQTTQASKSAFICSLSVVVVPIVNAIIYKKSLPATTWLASILAVIGVGMLTLEGAHAPTVGDLWSLGQPLAFGVAFVKTEQCMSENKNQALAMTASQMSAVFACSLIWVSFVLTARTPNWDVLYEPTNIAALIYTGVITSAFAVVAETVALAHISAEETTVILSTEPLWAAAFGAAVLGETMNGWGYVGGMVIVGSLLLSNLKLPPAMEARVEGWFGKKGGGGGGEEE